MIDIFLSYRRETGTEICSFLYKFFTKKGYEVFFDHDSIRQGEYEKIIEKAIKECSVFLVLLSKKELDRCINDPEKDWMLKEIMLAIKYGKTIIPVAFKKDFVFPENTGLDALDHLSKQQICDISGPHCADLIQSKLFDIIKDLCLSSVVKMRNEYQNGINDSGYLEWELNTLESIYSDCGLCRLGEKTYPVVTIDGAASVVYPFDELNRKENYSENCEPLDYTELPLYEDFRRIVEPTIHYPDLYGYNNAGIILDDGKVCGFKAVPRTYKETAYTGHIMHYELWKAYKRLGGRSGSLDDLAIRKKIHTGVSSREVLLSGCNRSALSAVCISVIAKDRREKLYKIAIAQRSNDVACYPGYYSIVPTGGFELYELEYNQTPEVIRRNFHIIAALYREYIEEIFGDTNFDKPTGDDDFNRIFRNEHIRQLEKGIDAGNMKFEFLGVTFDLISLRPTFAFVLRIDDENYLDSNYFQRNSENKSLNFVPLSELESMESKKNKRVWIPESAGVYSMLKKNHLFIEAKEYGSKNT